MTKVVVVQTFYGLKPGVLSTNLTWDEKYDNITRPVCI